MICNAYENKIEFTVLLQYKFGIFELKREAPQQCETKINLDAAKNIYFNSHTIEFAFSVTTSHSLTQEILEKEKRQIKQCLPRLNENLPKFSRLINKKKKSQTQNTFKEQRSIMESNIDFVEYASNLHPSHPYRISFHLGEPQNIFSMFEKSCTAHPSRIVLSLLFSP